MLLKELTIENFGIYKGKHSIDLTVEDGKPVILFGGLNGGGKTTFLDALQLVLYGKHAKCSNRGTLAYGTFLASTLNRFVEEDETASLELTFTHTTETDEQEFTVHRSWKLAKYHENTKDKVTVTCNGEVDQHISQYWDEFVNEFIPLSLSDLFFFDGEKIENLAHPERSADLIKTGIENLLGLDLLSQLNIDLSNIERKRKTNNVDDSVIKKVEICEQEIGENNAVVSSLRKQIAELEQAVSDTNVEINQARQKVRNSGAHLIDERDNIQFELGTIRQKLKDNLQQRVKLDAGCGPLALIPKLLKASEAQAELEQVAQQSAYVDSAISTYESRILETLREQKLPNTAMSEINAVMAAMAQERGKLAATDVYLGIAPNVFNGLNEKIAEDSVERNKLKKQRELLLEQQALYEKKEESIPIYDTVKHLLSDLAGLEAEFKNKVLLIERTIVQLDQALAKREMLNQRYTQLLTQQSRDTFEQKRALQVVSHIEKLKETMHGFAKNLVRENIELLETKITEKFIALSRKDNLISGVKICPDSFSLSLLSSANSALTPSRLSAGERQLLAIAILWGLAEASGKELPTVIDTPLGRLDGKHRRRLIENYFPFAAKQVLLLSTDEEIAGEYYTKLKPAVNREYHISFDEQANTSTFSQGYF
ncbi:DNA sulfur modification protein DndD [Paraglaciecola chathamensis]|uniref:DNA sulfur modification protein DndD n=1 Tax=Paraglaciecola chathamensis TaxID=368405 RepID=UPI00270A45AA|nr:DNA sulfur modification protein DndD [Paraglaciecola chathamensis]MDO6559908.1 DNA sulfur modification protein DndD [Paraglaciecola chathamensis]